MWLKLILLGIVAVWVYRLMGGKVPILDAEEKPSAHDTDGDTLVACDTCGTYVTIRESITIAGKHYCSQECIPD